MKTEEKEKIELLAERIKLLFGFCAEFIPDIELLKNTFIIAADKENFAESAAPVLCAFGIDYEEKSLEWRIRKERAKALINFIEVLARTEKERTKMKERKVSMAETAKMFGL